MDHEHPADSRRVLVRAGATQQDGPAVSPDGAAERAGLRLLLALVGTAAVGLFALPLSLLVAREFPPLVEADDRLSRAAEGAVAGSEVLLRAAQAVTLLGDPFLMTALAGLLAGLLLGRGHRRLALYVVVARVGAIVLSQGLKALLGRVRPVFDEPVAVADGGSFPSGHSLGSAAFYLTTLVVLLPLLRGGARRLAWALGAAAVLLPVLVAASRVLLGVHYLSDVVGGLLLGAGWAVLCTAVFAAWRADEGHRVAPLTAGLEPEEQP